MLTFKTIFNTATFQDDSDYAYPEVGSNGEAIDIVIQHHHIEDVDKSITVQIGDMQFTPDQLEKMLDLVERYKVAVKAF